jgi:hypothetical protein
MDTGMPVVDEYIACVFTGDIRQVTLDVSGDLIVDDEREMIQHL